MSTADLLSLQLGVLRLGFLQDGDVGFGVFPESEEILVGGERPDAGGIGVKSLRSPRLQVGGWSAEGPRAGRTGFRQRTILNGPSVIAGTIC